MRSLLVLTFLFASFSALAKSVPNLVCVESRIVNVDPRSLKVQEYESRTAYRFTDGNLYLARPEKKEYLYNKVVEVEPQRYTTGHKVIQFEGTPSEFKAAILVHAYRDEVRVSRLSCRLQ